MPSQPVECRDCGAIGTEDETDPAPGLCPRCLAARMDVATIYVAHLATIWPPQDVLGWAGRYLVEKAGLTESAAAAFVEELAGRI